MVVDLPESTWPMTIDRQTIDRTIDQDALTDNVNMELVFAHSFSLNAVVSVQNDKGDESRTTIMNSRKVGKPSKASSSQPPPNPSCASKTTASTMGCPE